MFVGICDCSVVSVRGSRSSQVLAFSIYLFLFVLVSVPVLDFIIFLGYSVMGFMNDLFNIFVSEMDLL